MAFYQLDGELKVVGLLPIFYGKLCETKGILEAFSIGELMKESKGTIYHFILMWNGNSMYGTHEAPPSCACFPLGGGLPKG